MIENFRVNTDLVNYLMETVKTISKCDIEEKVHSFPYTRLISNFFKS